MKCQNCGAETNSKYCEFCGSELIKDNTSVNITNNNYSEERESTVGTDMTGRCPKCNGTKISFKRERIGTSSYSNSQKNFIGTGRNGQYSSYTEYRTVGVCQNCGCTWDPNVNINTNQAPKKKTWLWVLGWIFIFPVPLTILIVKNQKLNKWAKIGIIAGAWILFLLIGTLSGTEGETDPGENNGTDVSQVYEYITADQSTELYI